jgi:hypothetical protein
MSKSGRGVLNNLVLGPTGPSAAPARSVAEQLSKIFKQPVAADNKHVYDFAPQNSGLGWRKKVLCFDACIF